MKIVFLGTNGWYSTETGNTPCVLVDSDDCYVVFDAGDGISKLDSYIASDKPIFLFLSHSHLEHIIGFHAASKFRFKQGIDVYGQKGTRRILKNLIKHPFTVPLDELPTKIKISELAEGTYKLPIEVTCKFLVHSDPCLGYRVTLDGKTITYCTDTGVCDASLELAKDADILIHECASKSGQYLQQWPHTNPREAAELASEARVKQLVLFHFDAELYKTMEERKEAEAEAKKIFKNTIAAVDGTTITI